MADVIKQAEANDPARLKQRIAELERQLKSGKTTVDPKAIEAAEARGEARGRKQAENDPRELERAQKDRDGRLVKIEALAHLNGEAWAPKPDPATIKWSMAGVRAGRSRPVGELIADLPKSTPPRKSPSDASPSDLGKCERSILSALAQHSDEGCQRGKLALLAGYRWSGGFRNSLSTLRMAGLIEGGNNTAMHITEAGLDSGQFEPLPTGQALVSYWLNNPLFGKCERAILASLVENPAGMTASELCEATHISKQSFDAPNGGSHRRAEQRPDAGKRRTIGGRRGMIDDRIILRISARNLQSDHNRQQLTPLLPKLL
jgi:hypothetical protein